MKKILLTAVFALATVVSYGQEKPADAKKHTCTETCDHGDHKEMKHEMSCCKAAAAEGKECAKCSKKEVKSCCKDSSKESNECAHGGKSDKKAAEKAEMKKSCCSKEAKSEKAAKPAKPAKSL